MKKVWRRVKEIFGLLVVLVLIMWWFVTFNKETVLGILYENMPQYAYLDKYILQDRDVSLRELIEFSDGGEGEKKDFVGKRIHFAAHIEGGWGNVYVYKGYKVNEVTADWQSYVQGNLGGYVGLRWGKTKKIPEGFAEVDGVITDIQIFDEITPVVYVKKIEKKDFEDIEWEDWQAMTEKDFEVKKEIKPDIEITKGGLKRYFKSIEFSDMGAELTFIPEKLKESAPGDENRPNGTMGNVEIDYNGKKYRKYPAASLVEGNEYISEETFFIKGVEAKGTLKMQIPIVGSEKPEIIEISLDDAK